MGERRKGKYPSVGRRGTFEGENDGGTASYSEKRVEGERGRDGMLLWTLSLGPFFCYPVENGISFTVYLDID